MKITFSIESSSDSHSVTASTAIFAAFSFGNLNTPVDMQQKATLLMPLPAHMSNTLV